MKKINETFACVHCGYRVPLADKTCRNHCPECFASLHVDGDVPGDRSAECGGIMYPINYELKNWIIKILFQCSKCGKQHWNKRTEDDKVEKLNELISEYRKYFN